MTEDELKLVRLDARVALLEMIVTQGLRVYARTHDEPRNTLLEWANHLREGSRGMTVPHESPERSMLLTAEFQEHQERFLTLLLQGFR